MWWLDGLFLVWLHVRGSEPIHTVARKGLKVTLETQEMSVDDRNRAIKEVERLLALLNGVD